MAEMILGLGIDRSFWLGAVRVSKDADALANELSPDAYAVAVPMHGWTPVAVRLHEGREYIDREFGPDAASYGISIKGEKIPSEALGIFLHPQHARRFRDLLQQSGGRRSTRPYYWCRGVWVVPGMK